MKRNATLSIRKPEPTSQARAAAFNKPVVMSFYDQLIRVKVKFSFKPNQVWNLDETSNTTVEAPPNVVASKGTKQICLKLLYHSYSYFIFIMVIILLLKVQQTVSGERGDNLTMLAFICADGSSIPPPQHLFSLVRRCCTIVQQGTKWLRRVSKRNSYFFFLNTFSKVVTTLPHLFKAG
jgi:hypothetical protein